MWSWHIVMACALVGVASAEDRWVWGTSNPEAKARRIPGFVPTTPEPPITTFRPTLPPLVGRGSNVPSRFHNSLPNHPAFFPGGMFPFDFVPSDVPRINEDGTTKTRITADTATLDSSSGATLTANDKYTTLDRLQRERGPAPTFPPAKRHQLGGLHPDEVYYADDDLLIIRGGGFNSDVFQEPAQPLDEEEDIDETTRIVSALPPPSSDQEYNGNVPSIIPPPRGDSVSSIPVVLPQQVRPSPFSIFVGGSSNKDYILVPFVQRLDSSKPGNGIQTITHNRLTANENQASSKLRRAASNMVSYRYQTPTSTFFLQQPRRQPPVQQNHHHQQQPTVQQLRIVQNRIIAHRQPIVHQQRVITRPATVHREPLIQYQPVIQQRPVVVSHYQVPGNPVVQNHPVVLPAPTKEYSELELQPDVHRVVHSLEGDTNVNFLAPLPPRNPAAEVFTPQSYSPAFTQTSRRTQHPRV